MAEMKKAAMLASNRNSFMILGVLEAAWAPMVPYIKDRFDLDESQLGFLLLASGLGGLLTLPLAGYSVARLGSKLETMIFGIAISLSLLAITLSPNLALTAVLLFCFGIATVCIDVSSNVNAVILEGIYKRPLMSGFHGGYSLGTIVGAALVSMMLSVGFGIVPSAIVITLVGIATVMFGCRALISDVKKYDNAPQSEVVTEQSQKPSRKIPGTVIVIGFLCFFMYSSEGAVLSWSAVFVHQERGMSLEYAGFIYTAFACTMTGMRFLGNRIVLRAGRRRTVFIGGLLVSIGFFVTLIPHVFFAALGFAIVGLGAANVVPQMVSFAGTVKGMPVHKIITVVNALGYSGLLLGPVIIGFVAKNISIAAAFFGIAVIGIVVAFTNRYIMRPDNPAVRH